MLHRFTLIAASLLICVHFVRGEVPRYLLPVGKVLTYSGESREIDPSPGAMQMSSTMSWRLTVVGENPDGSKRVIAKATSSFRQGDRPASERTAIGYCDIFPDGRIPPNPTIGPTMSIAPLLPKLPASDDELKSGWTSPGVAGAVTKYAFTSDREGVFTFTADEQGPMNRIYVTTSGQTFSFDRAKGLVTRSGLKTSQDYGFHTKGTGSLTLKSEETIEPAKAQALRKEYDNYFAALDAYRTTMRDISKDPAKVDQFLTAGRKILEEAKTNAAQPEVKADLDEILKQHAGEESYERDSAKRFADVLNQPAKAWSSTDLTGQPFSMAGLSGKVVVMDFWYRGCGWCMYAMPQIKQLAQDYKDKNVIVLGMNTDRDIADAKLVVSEFDLTYPQIRAEQIPGLFGVQGFPTTIVIDQNGIVRGIHVGYSPALHDDVAKQIEELLKR